jgi:hypothetical protein
MVTFDEADGKRPGLHEIERLPYGISVLLVGGLSALPWGVLIGIVMALRAAL